MDGTAKSAQRKKVEASVAITVSASILAASICSAFERRVEGNSSGAHQIGDWQVPFPADSGHPENTPGSPPLMTLRYPTNGTAANDVVNTVIFPLKGEDWSA